MVVTQKNGTLDLNSIMPLRKVLNAQHKQSLLSEDTISVKVESKEPLDLFIGDKIEYAGRFFYLNSMPKVQKEQGIYAYDLSFEGAQYLLRKKIYFNLDKTGFQTTADFPLTGEIDIFLKVLIDNINKVDTGWILGEFPKDTDTKTITFADENCLAVLQRICQEFGTEFEIKESVTSGTKTLNIKSIGDTKDYTFEYGMNNGLYSIHRDNVSDDVVTRLYVYGASDNLPSNYRDYSTKLRMPEANGDYLQDDSKIALFGMKEAVKVFEDIKPTFKGVVSSVGNFDKINGVQEFTADNMDFDLMEKDPQGNTKYLIASTPAKIHFNKGNLAGYEFELVTLTGYNHADKRFRIKQYTDERGQKFPDNDTIFKVEVGDEFTLLDITMPQAYIDRAEQKLLEAGQNEYKKQSQNNTKYSIQIDPLYLAQKGGENTLFFEIGDYIRIKDEPLKIDKTSRITSLTRDLLNPYNYTLEIADTYEISFTASVLNDIKDTKKIVKTQKQVIRENFKNGYKNIAELKEAIFDTEGYFDTENIKPNSIETNMLSVGTKNQQFVLEDVTLDPNHNGSPASVSITGGKLVHFTIADYVKDWFMLPLEQTGLLDIVYYVYAKVERTGVNGSWYITTDKIKFDEIPEYYHFLCYLLYTPKDGKREAEAMYGNTLIHGGQVTTGRIKFTNGQTYFDLDSGEISGKITFTLPDGTKTTNIEQSMLGSTIVEGGKIKTNLLNVDEILVGGNSDIADIKAKTDNFTSIKGGLISSNIIEVGDNKDYQNAFISGVTDKDGESIRFGAGADYDQKENAPFKVLDNGKLIAKNADISSNINATNGNIGGFNLVENWLQVGKKDSWESWGNSVAMTDKFLNIRRNGGIRGNTKEVWLGNAYYSADPNGTIAVAKIINNLERDFFNYYALENVALHLEASNHPEKNIALDIVKGGIRIKEKTGYTGSFSYLTEEGAWANQKLRTTIEITDGIITNITRTQE